MKADRDISERLARRLVDHPKAPNERAFHQDLSERGTASLRKERDRLRLALLISSHPDPWACERLACIDRELEARHAR